MQHSPDQPICTEMALGDRRYEALRRIRRGASAAYFQGGVTAFAAAAMLSAGDRGSGLLVLVAGTVVIALGAWLARAKAAAPAAQLVVALLGFAAWLWSVGVQWPTALAVVALAWRFGEAYRAARTLR